MAGRPEQTLDMTDLGAAIGEAVAKGIAAIAPRKEPREGDPEFEAQLRAEGFYDEFPKAVWQNGYQAQGRGLSEETRRRACSLTPGTYKIGRRNPINVTVAVDSRGETHLSYPTVKVDDRFANQLRWHDFGDLIDQLWAAMHPDAA